MLRSLSLAACAVLAAVHGAAGEDILLTPPHTGGIPVGVIAIEGAEIANGAYAPLMKQLQAAAAPDSPATPAHSPPPSDTLSGRCT